MRKRSNMKGRLGALLAIVMLSSVLLTMAPAAAVMAASTYYVDDSGGADFTTIQAAVTAASAGDTITVKDGAYVENIIVDKSLVIQTENGAAAVTVTAADGSQAVFNVTAGPVTIEGFTVTGTTNSNIGGIEVYDASSCLIANNVVTGCAIGIRLGGATTDTTVAANNCHDNTKYGLSIRNNAFGNFITRNTFQANTSKDICIKDTSHDNTLWLNDILSSGVEILTSAVGNSPTTLAYTYNSVLYIGYLGNYYSSYSGADADGNGVGDTAFTSGTYTDSYPLMAQSGNYAEGWSLNLEGAVTYVMAQEEFEEGVAHHGAVTYTDGSGIWSGLPLWLLVGRVDDEVQHGAGAFNDALAAAGYEVKLIASDGYSQTFPSIDVARNDDMIVANTLNGAPLPEDRFPLRLVGPGLSGAQKVSCVIEIELVFPEEGLPPVAGFTADTTTGTAPLTVHFTDQSTESPTAWAWDFENDGTVDSNDQNPTYIYSSVGTYTVNMTASNAFGSDDEVKADYITVITPPAFGMTPNSGPAGTFINVTVGGLPASTSGRIWFDVDGDGVMNNGETAPYGNLSTDGSGSISAVLTVPPEIATGTYTVKADFPLGDSIEASADFTVTAGIVLNTSSGIAGATTFVTGSGFAADTAGTVWFDTDNNGALDAGEPSVAVTTGTDGAIPVLTRLAVPSVAAGAYTVQADIPDGGGIEASATFTVTASGVIINPTYGNGRDSVFPPMTPSGGGFTPSTGFNVWVDRNRNGLRDTGEGYKSGTTTSTGEIPSTIGTFSWSATPAGLYRVLFDLNKDGTVEASAGTVVIGSIYMTTSSGLPGANIGMNLDGFPALTAGYVWFDTNGDGVMDPDENRAPVTVSFVKGDATSPGLSVPTVTPGPYSIRADIPAGGRVEASATYTVKGLILDPASGTAGTNINITGFGLMTNRTGNIWFDTNGNEVKDAEEPQVAASTDAGGVLSPVSLTAPTAPGGDYQVLADIPTGGYAVDARATFTLLGAPGADFSADILSGYSPLTVHFTDQSAGGPTSWAWDFDNDGTVDSNDQNPTYVFTGAGKHAVKLTATNDYGSDDEVKEDYIEILPVTAVSVSPATSIVANGATFNINIDIYTDTACRAWQLNVDFDASKMSANSVTEGTFLSAYAAANGGGTTPGPGGVSIDNTGGHIIIPGYAITGAGTGGPTGSGTLCTISFTAKPSVDSVASISTSEVFLFDTDFASIPDVILNAGDVIIGSPPLPDLLVTSAYTEGTPADSEYYTITYTITNIGSEPAGASITSISIDGGEALTIACPALGPGESDTENTTVITLEGTADAVLVTADSTSAVNETNEDNNTRSTSYSFAPSQPGDVPVSGYTQVLLEFVLPDSVTWNPMEIGDNSADRTMKVISNTNWQVTIRGTNGGFMTKYNGTTYDPAVQLHDALYVLSEKNVTLTGAVQVLADGTPAGQELDNSGDTRDVIFRQLLYYTDPNLPSGYYYHVVVTFTASPTL